MAYKLFRLQVLINSSVVYNTKLCSVCSEIIDRVTLKHVGQVGMLGQNRY